MIVRAAIFDLDGTIIDSEEQWGKAYSKVFKSLGADVNENESHIFGASVEYNLKNQISKHNIKTAKTIEELETQTFIEFQKLISEITLNDGVIPLMENLRESGVPLALATSTNWDRADRILKEFDLANFFEDVTTVEEIVNPKPAPDIYLVAAEKLGVDESDCLVFEDSPSGVTAAKEAGMKVIAIDPTGENKELESADLVIGQFSEATPQAIAEL